MKKIDGEETHDLSDVCRVFRSCHRGTIDEAAAEAWGSKTNIFNKGFARQTDDPAIVAATMAKPGVVLRRPVGSNGSFSEDAELPHLPTDELKENRALVPHR